MSETSKKPGVACWATVMLVAVLAPILYVASFGPACWLFDRGLVPISLLHRAYFPAMRMSADGPVRPLLRAYVGFGCRHPHSTLWHLQISVALADFRNSGGQLP